MSGIYISGMEMPKSENVVILINPSGGVWMIGDMPNEDTYLVKAKAIPVPDHGRLIDADALSRMYDPYEICGAAVLEIIADTPTIIQADKEAWE